MFLFRFIPFGLFVIAWLGLTLASPASAIDGHEWMTFPSERKTAYVMGVVDTWGMVTEVIEESGDTIGVSPDEYRKKDFTSTFYHKLTSCLRESGVGYAQVESILPRGAAAVSPHERPSILLEAFVVLDGICQQDLRHERVRPPSPDPFH